MRSEWQGEKRIHETLENEEREREKRSNDKTAIERDKGMDENKREKKTIIKIKIHRRYQKKSIQRSSLPASCRQEL